MLKGYEVSTDFGILLLIKVCQMSEQQYRTHHRGPVEFQRFIMNYQSKKSEIQNLQRTRGEAQISTDRKYHFNNQNSSYEFPLPGDELSSSSDYPSLLGGQTDIHQQSTSFMANQGKRSNSFRKIMNLKKIRDLVLSKEKDHSLMAKKDLSKTVIVKEINLNTSPKKQRRNIRNISKQMIMANKSMSAQPSPKHAGTEKKINIQLSIEKYKQQKLQSMGLAQKENQSREQSKDKQTPAGPRRIQSFKNILPGNRRPIKHTAQLFIKEKSEGFVFGCCQEKPKQNIPPVSKQSNRTVERREIKIITLKNGINRIHDNQSTYGYTDQKLKPSSSRPTSDEKDKTFGTASKRQRII